MNPEFQEHFRATENNPDSFKAVLSTFREVMERLPNKYKPTPPGLGKFIKNSLNLLRDYKAYCIAKKSQPNDKDFNKLFEIVSQRKQMTTWPDGKWDIGRLLDPNPPKNDNDVAACYIQPNVRAQFRKATEKIIGTNRFVRLLQRRPIDAASTSAGAPAATTTAVPALDPTTSSVNADLNPPDDGIPIGWHESGDDDHSDDGSEDSVRSVSSMEDKLVPSNMKGRLEESSNLKSSNNKTSIGRHKYDEDPNEVSANTRPYPNRKLLPSNPNDSLIKKRPKKLLVSKEISTNTKNIVDSDSTSSEHLSNEDPLFNRELELTSWTPGEKRGDDGLPIISSSPTHTELPVFFDSWNPFEDHSESTSTNQDEIHSSITLGESSELTRGGIQSRNAIEVASSEGDYSIPTNLTLEARKELVGKSLNVLKNKIKEKEKEKAPEFIEENKFEWLKKELQARINEVKEIGKLDENSSEAERAIRSLHLNMLQASADIAREHFRRITDFGYISDKNNLSIMEDPQKTLSADYLASNILNRPQPSNSNNSNYSVEKKLKELDEDANFTSVASANVREPLNKAESKNGNG
ncbi:hypothetical protein [Actimicrobium sp. CCI2.3]|uniref:hypothetical protein n=1 Tax=Actimicrobium sp. CCI2.3 TaxID=3048616 RepID=UPI002AB56150|nr:hypothetical protein [Actimicrobium sp. CCI2.3]MDY7573226.1 hypothetical protein [Actimicrobium sp. CCI2.3]MEB0022205.1 hypothetical protein [Actimicrobium sp. CCI2.3]